MDMNATSDQLDQPRNPEVHHERSDVSVYGIMVFGIGLLVSAVIIYLFIWGLFDYFAGRTTQGNRPLPAPAAWSVGEPVPPEPRLQVSPQDDLQTLRAAEDATLNNYGWVDRQTGKVRIPIEQAMQRLAERGLPVQQEAAGEFGKPHDRQR